MTWTRQELKARAKNAFKRNYWKCVLVAFIITLITPSGGSSSSMRNSYNNNSSPNGYEMDTPQFDIQQYSEINTNDAYYSTGYNAGQAFETALLSGVIVILLIVMIVGMALSILVFNPLQVGGCSFFLENSWINSAGPGLLLHAFKHNYKTTILTMFLRNLYIGLWTLLFIIPGIVKAYEYRMVPYLLADYPEMSRREIFNESKQLMKGYKWDAFVLDLSFFGWMLLSSLTFGLLGIFYVNPYIYATNAELYLALKRDTAQTTY